jgi:hypothetical protein
MTSPRHGADSLRSYLALSKPSFYSGARITPDMWTVPDEAVLV